ncbi:ER lumen protein retaining receptor family protein [Cryptosporidium meleagridis]|uniref:ER lumen protein retaining receptor family protein n=1 Tax=Cryptosporidium meleagridis TaxID=93969 RepID=A0A2P4Z078_9CRYT|nr:ER lumen protein retaining receptor family protein [Cryptosporidium meleagridis]
MQKKPIFHNFAFILDVINFATALSWFCAYLALFLKLKREKNVVGLSLQTMLMLVVAECNHVLITAVLSSHYHVELGLDFYLCDCSTALLSAVTFAYIYFNFYETYESNRDTFGLNVTDFIFCWILKADRSNYFIQKKSNRYYSISKKIFWLTIYILNIFLGLIIFFLRKSSSPPIISFWESYMDSLLSLALLPQIFMFYNKKPRKVSSLLAHFVVFILLARVFMLLYWILYPLFKLSIVPGRKLHIFSESLNVTFLMHFMYYFIRSKLNGENEILLPL